MPLVLWNWWVCLEKIPVTHNVYVGISTFLRDPLLFPQFLGSDPPVPEGYGRRAFPSCLTTCLPLTRSVGRALGRLGHHDGRMRPTAMTNAQPMALLSLLLAHVFISQAVRVSAAVTGLRSLRYHAIDVSSAGGENPPPHTPLLDELVRFPRGGWVPGQNIHSYIDKLFDGVDEDRDGGISIEDNFMNASFCYT